MGRCDMDSSSFHITISQEITLEILKYVLGALAAGLMWMIRNIRQNKKDIDQAFTKIRKLEEGK